MTYDLDRFVTAQNAGGSHDSALAELRRGRKTSHWMWFVFPQVAGLGRSAMAQRYAVAGLAQARAYLHHPILGPRLVQAAQAVLDSGDVYKRQAAHLSRRAGSLPGAPGRRGRGDGTRGRGRGGPVSYTHLDVYKRQRRPCPPSGPRRSLFWELVCAHFVAMTVWLEGLRMLPHLPGEARVPFTLGLGLSLIGVSCLGTVTGYTLAGEVPGWICLLYTSRCV